MKYYQLTYSIDNKEIGCFPQSESAENFGFMMSDLSIFKVDPIPVLKSKAKLTSLLLSVPISTPKLIVDDELLIFLTHFLKDDYLTKKIKVRKGKIFYENYNLFVLPNSVKSEIIRFKESEFNLGKWSDWNFLGAKLEIENEEDFSNFNKEFKETDHYIKPNLLNLNFSNINEDFFRVSDVPLISGHYFVSQKFKNAIEKERFTGFSFQEIEQMDNRIKVTY